MRLKRLQQNKVLISSILIIIVFSFGLFYLTRVDFSKLTSSAVLPRSKFTEILKKPIPTLAPKPKATPTPTPRPLTFNEMNSLYGPCVRLPVLMYHHVQSRESAQAAKQTSLTVFTDVFQTQMEYLKNNNYITVDTVELANFFDSGIPLPSRSVILTFDDGYQDFYTDAYPILNRLGLKSIVFLPTGLMQNPGYLTWDEISVMKGNVLFANHTWSHKSVVVATDVMQKEILTADSQLADHGLNNPKTFAYPYGPDSLNAEKYLDSLQYKVTFTTSYGNTLCKKMRFSLPRIRIGNNSLSNYGF